MNNYVFVDAQNLHVSTTRNKESPWKVDEVKLLKFLRRKYRIHFAKIFFGRKFVRQEELYIRLALTGWEVVFREHDEGMKSSKKGNVDTDIVFEMMRTAMTDENLGSINLISGDGDYYKAVEFLITERKFGKIFLPVREAASGLYRRLEPGYVETLDRREVREEIEQEEWRGPRTLETAEE